MRCSCHREMVEVFIKDVQGFTCMCGPKPMRTQSNTIAHVNRGCILRGIQKSIHLRLSSELYISVVNIRALPPTSVVGMAISWAISS